MSNSKTCDVELTVRYHDSAGKLHAMCALKSADFERCFTVSKRDDVPGLFQVETGAVDDVCDNFTVEAGDMDEAVVKAMEFNAAAMFEKAQRTYALIEYHQSLHMWQITAVAELSERVRKERGRHG